jgi:hypothetical protein
MNIPFSSSKAAPHRAQSRCLTGKGSPLTREKEAAWPIRPWTAQWRLKEAVREAISIEEQIRLFKKGGENVPCVAYGMFTAGGALRVPHRAATADAATCDATMVSRSFDDIASFPIRSSRVKNMAGKADLSNFSQMDMMSGEKRRPWAYGSPDARLACLFLRRAPTTSLRRHG